MAISRAQQQEGDETFLLQSFLISSVPSLVARASSMLSSAPNDEMLIAQALNQLNTDGQNAFNDAYGPAARNSRGPECQPAFIRACFKRGLLRHEHAQQLLASTGDTTLPGSPQPDRMRLADAVRSTQQKQQQIIDDLSGEGASVSLQAEGLCEVHQACLLRRPLSLIYPSICTNSWMGAIHQA